MVDSKSATPSPASKRGPRPVNLRLRRLLVMLPWLMERGSVSTQEMADHFGLSVKELVAELTLASLCGVSQDPLDLIDLWVDEDEVHVGVPKYFERPLRLTVRSFHFGGFGHFGSSDSGIRSKRCAGPSN